MFLEDLGNESSITLYGGDGASIIWEPPNEVACGYWRWIECFKIAFSFEKGQGQAEVAKVGMCVVGRVGKGRCVAPRKYCNTQVYTAPKCYDGRKTTPAGNETTTPVQRKRMRTVVGWTSR